jgi:colicin import membrane protein
VNTIEKENNKNMKAELLMRHAVLGVQGALLCTLLAACAANRPAPREVPPPPVTSVAQADQQLAAVARERAAIEARFAERERICYDKFFVNRCLDEAKEHRRSALAAQRAIEVQAERFKRQAAVDERDRKLAEADKRYREEEARLAAQPPQPTRTVEEAPPPRAPTVPKRIAERDARLKAVQAKEAADAPKRAKNVRDFERRKVESEEHQRDVARKKAERAAKAAKKAEEDKAKAAKTANPASVPAQ